MNLEELQQIRLKWIDANRENQFEVGIKRLLTDLYPDDAHFIYEVLQNAEDAGASQVKFTLNSDSVEFEHNGSRLFSMEDVKSITSIGDSNKKDDPTSIGKFGIGFKAVFAYTSTPIVESGEYHFCIRDLVVPDTEDLPPRAIGGSGTRFIFPFNNPEKPVDRAHSEIEKNILQLDESTLLFLSNIKRIEYRLSNATSGFLELKEIDGHHIEISVQHPDDIEPVSIHYLRFENNVDVVDGDEIADNKTKTCRIAVAYRLKEIEEAKQSSLQLNPPQWEIIPIEKDGASAGRVSIYFPAEKETSNLRFHLHAPFASTVARASIRECAANNELRDDIADLIAESMFIVRDKRLLTVKFLSTLPNDKDNLPEFYRPIQTRLVEEFNYKKITPMKNGGYTPAANTYRGGRDLSDLLNDCDLATILGKDYSSPLWVANPPLRNQREDDFLSLLAISEWDEKDLIDRLHCNPEIVQRWLPSKENEWHQGLYTLLYDFVQRAPTSSLPYYRRSHYPESERKLKELRIIKCSDSIYRCGDECYFPSNDVENDKGFPRVIKAIYTSGTSKKQQDKARKFLEDIGVREVGEAEQVEAILKQRYVEDRTEQRERNHGRDMRRFIELVEKDSSKAELFKDYCIFKVEHEPGWEKAGMVFLDLPYCDTGLSAYYDENVILATPKGKLYQDYSSYHIEPERLRKFAEEVGAQTRLEVLKQEIPRGRPGGRGRHPEYGDLVANAPGEKNSRHSINEDYNIVGFKSLLDHLSIEKAKLIWRTMQDLPVECLYARYRRSQSYEPRIGSSTLVHILKGEEWVPQIKDGQSAPCKFVIPEHAVAGDLPPGFLVKAGSAWLSAIEFGNQAAEATQEHQNKKNVVLALGFPSLEDAENMAKMLEEDPTIIKEWKARKHKPDFPESTPHNPSRRIKQVTSELEEAPNKAYESKNRNVRTTSPSLDPTIYLREKYTNKNYEMVCQICKKEMPFKKRDGEYYFETVEAFSNDYFSKEHEGQYLALCPVCAARYKEFVKYPETKAPMEELHNKLVNSEKPDIPLDLGELKANIRFVETHFHEMKIILKQQ